MAMFEIHAVDEQIKALPTVDTASGSIATFETDIEENLIDVECEIVYQQAEGTPTPTSSIPIKVFSEMNVAHIEDTDKMTWLQGVMNGSYQFKKLSDCTWSYDSGRSVFYTTGIKGYKNGTPFLTIAFSDAHNVGLDEVPNMGGTLRAAALYLKNTSYTDVSLFVASLGNDYCIYELETPITPTYTASDFNAMLTAFGIDGSLYNIPFGQTVAKGTLNVTTGVLDITEAMTLISGLTWTYDSTNTRFTTLDLRGIVKNVESNTEPLEGLSCECYQVSVASSSRQVDLSVAVNTTGIMVLKDTNYNTEAGLISAVGNYKIVYPLATPTTIQLSATQITALLNENNIWCDTGDTSVKYILSVGKAIS